jgi:hypothetical protein
MNQDHYGHFLLIVPCSITTSFNNAKFPILLEIPDGSTQRSKIFDGSKDGPQLFIVGYFVWGFSSCFPFLD